MADNSYPFRSRFHADAPVFIPMFGYQSSRPLITSAERELPMERINAQMICGPPRNYNGPEPPNDAEVYVRNIPPLMPAYDLVDLFSRVGSIYKLRVLLNRDGMNRGFGFVHFFTRRDAKLAVYYFKEYTLPSGVVIKTVKSRNNRQLLISGLPFNVSQERVLEDVVVLTEGVTSVRLLPPNATNNEGLRAIITYDSHGVAVKALRHRLIGSRIAGVPIIVDWARPNDFANPY